MLFRFTKARQKLYIKQMIVWTAGIFIIVPLGMMLMFYSINMPPDKYGISVLEMFKQGGGVLLIAIWFIGAFAAFIAHVFNPIHKNHDDDNAG